MRRTEQFYVILSIFFGIFLGVFCENHSSNPFNFQLNKKTELEGGGYSKGNFFENPLQKQFNERRRLLFNDDTNNPAANAEKEETNEFSARRRTNFSETENEKTLDWENVRLQFPLPVNSDNSRNFADFSARQPFTGMKNHRYEWEKRDDVFEKSQSRWNEEKNFQTINQDSRGRDHFNGRYGGVFRDSEMNREDKRGENFDRKVSITTLNDAEVENKKLYHEDRLDHIHSGYLGHSNMNHYNRNPNSFWNPNFYKPEKGLVINLNTECSTPRQFNNQLVHKFIFAPKSPVGSHPEFSAFQIPESGYVSPHRINPVYYI